MSENIAERIVIARTDSIGDVMLTLPLCTILKQEIPGCKIVFIGRTYTQAVAEACDSIDRFMNWDEVSKLSPDEQIRSVNELNASAILHVFPRKEITWVAKRARIPLRVATGRRWYTLTKCNKLVFFSRRKSDLHESQLNLKLLEGLGIHRSPTLSEIPELYRFTPKESIAPEHKQVISKDKINVILHPLSKGSAVNWGLQHFAELIGLLDPQRFSVFITGTETEGKIIREIISGNENHVHDMTGKMTLGQLITFIDACDALVAASTGPLHIAAALGKKAIGLYSPLRPIHAGRWAPVGKLAEVLVASSHPEPDQPLDISPEMVSKRLLLFAEEKLKNR